MEWSIVSVLIFFGMLVLVLAFLSKNAKSFRPSKTHSSAIRRDQFNHRVEMLPTVKVVYVIDGDTVIVNKGHRKIRIRLDAIDAPEDGQLWGKQSKYGLIKIIGKPMVVKLEEHTTDHYGRTVASLFVQKEHDEWINVNERMIMLGHAWVMRRYYNHLPSCRKAKLNDLERWARSKTIGLWSMSNPIPPWKWRYYQRCAS
jgi:endonuclease YncB( thermonuclease family)